jgi:biofilm PGA synthesis N-glycosyltransferase PgaC
VRFLPGALGYPIEPHDLRFLTRQLRRWSHGFVQNLALHRQRLVTVPFLRSSVAVAAVDGVVSSAAYLFVLPLLALVLAQPWPLLGYLLDLPALVVLVIVGAQPRREVPRALACLPWFFVLRFVNSLFFLEAVWSELFRRRRLHVFEKGH